jgi:nicotinamidase-related amidase
MITPEETLLLVIDVQGRLAQSVYASDSVIGALGRMIRASRILEVPVLVTEQYPKGLGRTVDALMELLPGAQPVEKLSFSCCGDEGFMHRLRAFGRNDILLAGMETHVCVYQTAVELLDFGYNVHLLTDAVSSRTEENRMLGIRCIEKAGGALSSTEMAMFELLRQAGTDRFKAVSAILKEA